jgi:hypothetical protein
MDFYTRYLKTFSEKELNPHYALESEVRKSIAYCGLKPNPLG